MQKVITTLVTAALLIVITGCAPSWKLTKADFRTLDYTIKTPMRWMIIHKGSATLISNHGPALESILIRCHDIGDKIPSTTLMVLPNMLPHEIGELIISQQRAGPAVTDVEVTKESIAKVDNKKAVRVVFDYREDGIIFTDIVYGVLDGQKFYELRYCAAKRHYFNESLDVFELMVEHFKIR